MNDYLEADSVASDERTDAILEALGEQLQREAEGVYILNVPRAREFSDCYRELKHQLHGSRTKLSWEMDEMLPGCAVIRAESRGFRVKNTAKFAAALRLASNYEIYPKTNGNIMLALTFYGLKTKIGE